MHSITNDGSRNKSKISPLWYLRLIPPESGVEDTYSFHGRNVVYSE